MDVQGVLSSIDRDQQTALGDVIGILREALLRFDGAVCVVQHSKRLRRAGCGQANSAKQQQTG